MLRSNYWKPLCRNNSKTSVPKINPNSLKDEITYELFIYKSDVYPFNSAQANNYL